MQIENCNSRVNYAPNFRGIIGYEKFLINDKGKISKKAAKLVAALNEEIDSEWQDIRLRKIKDKTPIFFSKEGRKLTSIKPIYTQSYPAILVEQDNGKVTQRVLIDRFNPNNFQYEKTISTDHGSATLRSYDSRNCNDKEINMIVDNMLIRTLDDIISSRTLRNFFDESDFARIRGRLTLRTN